MKILRYSFFILFLLLAFGCYEKVDFDIKKERYLIVDALITSKSTNKMSVNLLDEESSTYTPVESASVFIEDNNGTTYDFLHTMNGEYILNASLDVNNSYRLFINWEGDEYQSSFQEFGKTLAQIESVEIKASREFYFGSSGNEEVLDLMNLFVRLDSRNSFYSIFDYEGIYKVESTPIESNGPRPNVCWFRDQVPDFLNVQGGVLPNEEFLLFEDVPSSKYRSYNLFVKQYAISNEAFAYWSELQKIRSEKGDLFSPPPSIVNGNIRAINEESVDVLGNFTLALFDSVRFEFGEGEIPLILKDECLPVTDTLPAVCFDCSLRSDTITVNEEPPFWLNP